MNYELIENITSADIAIRVKAPSLGLLFNYAVAALMSEMLEDINSIKPEIIKNGSLSGEDLPLLYFEFLNEFIFFKDAENLLLLPVNIEVSCTEGLYTFSYILAGEKIDKTLHKFRVDIKAVTLHELKLYETGGIFIAETVFDA